MSLPPVIANVVDLPRDEDGPVFAEPWEAQAFAIVVKLAEQGHYTWAEWVEVFSKEIASAKDAELNGEAVPGYYEHWLAAAEKIMIAKGLVNGEQLAAKKFGFAASRACRPLSIKT
jgi:nitrile hydratase accessory protein